MGSQAEDPEVDRNGWLTTNRTEGRRRDMRTLNELVTTLRRIDGRGYKAYREIAGEWAFPDFTLIVDHVQGDPFADPSRIRALLRAEVTALPRELCTRGSRSAGIASLLARHFAREARAIGRPRGSGKSGIIRMESPGQQVLAQTAVLVAEDGAVEARFGVGLPAGGRRILAEAAVLLLTEEVGRVIAATLRASAYAPGELRLHAETNEDADALREALAPRRLIAFVADGASLPRRSGIDDRPLEGSGVTPFVSPESLRIDVVLPNAGPVSGMGIPRGVTLIVGGGYHGKSTLLDAVQLGVYNHRPGDGRERVVADSASVKVRAEDGRSIVSVDISPFIGNLPGGDDTRRFTSPNASGSTSQAAGIAEAVEAGARVLLVDEDTAATNFMIRDRRMQELIPKEGEPITPFVDRVREIDAELGISSILVLGGSGDYLDVADLVIAMRDFVPRDVTDEARRIAERLPTGRIPEAAEAFPTPPERIPLPESLDPSRGGRAVRIDAVESHRIRFGTDDIDLVAVDQIVSTAQTRAIGRGLLFARDHLMDGKREVADILSMTMEILERDGLDVLDARKAGDLAAFRRFELAAALNRLRTLRIRGSDEPR